MSEVPNSDPNRFDACVYILTHRGLNACKVGYCIGQTPEVRLLGYAQEHGLNPDEWEVSRVHYLPHYLARECERRAHHILAKNHVTLGSAREVFSVTSGVAYEAVLSAYISMIRELTPIILDDPPNTSVKKYGPLLASLAEENYQETGEYSLYGHYLDVLSTLMSAIDCLNRSERKKLRDCLLSSVVELLSNGAHPEDSEISEIYALLADTPFERGIPQHPVLDFLDAFYMTITTSEGGIKYIVDDDELSRRAHALGFEAPRRGPPRKAFRGFLRID